MSQADYEVIRGIAQAAANAYDGALDDKGEPIKIGLKREEGHVVLNAELRTQPRSLRPSEFLKSKQPYLTQLNLRRKRQFIDTGDKRLDPLEVGRSLEANMELCSL